MIYERTKKDVRQAIGFETGAMILSTTTEPSNDTSLIDETLIGTDGDHRGKWIVAASGQGAGESQRVVDFHGAGKVLETTSFSFDVPTGMDYEMWLGQFPPQRVDQAINTSIQQVATRGAVVHIEDTTLTGSRATERYAIPAEFTYLRKVEYTTAATFTGEEPWYPLDRFSWRVDPAAHELVLSLRGRNIVDAKAMRLTGWRAPVLLVDDDDILEVEEPVVVALALSKLNVAVGGSSRTDYDDSRSIGVTWLQVAERMLSGLSTPQGVPL